MVRVFVAIPTEVAPKRACVSTFHQVCASWDLIMLNRSLEKPRSGEGRHLVRKTVMICQRGHPRRSGGCCKQPCARANKGKDFKEANTRGIDVGGGFSTPWPIH